MIDIFITEGLQMAISPLAVAGIGISGIGAIGNIFTRNKQKKEREKAMSQMRSDIRNRQVENKSWYSKNAMLDYTQRADSQNLLKNLRDNLKKRTNSAKSTAVITGATPAAQAVEKEVAAKAVSDTYSNVTAMGQRYKDNVTNQYLRRSEDLDRQMFSLNRMGLSAQEHDYNRRAGSWSNLLQTGLNVAAGSVLNPN